MNSLGISVRARFACILFLVLICSIDGLSQTKKPVPASLQASGERTAFMPEPADFASQTAGGLMQPVIAQRIRGLQVRRERGGHDDGDV